MTAVTCVGLAVVDHVFTVDAPPPGPGKHFADGYRQVGGGPAATAAVTVARLGGEARFVGHVGADPAGEWILADLAREGVDVSKCRMTADHGSPVSAVFVDGEGERTIVNHTAVDMFTGDDRVGTEDVAGSDVVLADVRWPVGAAGALRSAAEVGVPGVLDYDQSPVDVSHLAPLASHVVFGEPALVGLAGTDDAEAALQAIAATTDAFVAVTRGGHGVSWLEDGSFRHDPGFEVEVVDTLGAGDVFHGALALAIGEGRDDGDALRFASAAAALKCSRPGGGDGIPMRADVEDLMAGVS